MGLPYPQRSLVHCRRFVHSRHVLRTRLKNVVYVVEDIGDKPSPTPTCTLRHLRIGLIEDDLRTDLALLELNPRIYGLADVRARGKAEHTHTVPPLWALVSAVPASFCVRA